MARFLKKESKKIGTAPGALIFIGTQRSENVHIDAVTYNVESHQQYEKLSTQEAFDLIGDNVVTWINVIGLHDTTVMSEFGTLFEWHPLLQEDILNTEQRPKFDPFETHNAFILKMLKVDVNGASVQSEQISIIAGKNYLVSFQEAGGDVFDSIRERLIRPTTKIRHRGSDYLAFAMMDAITDNYILAIEHFGNEIENLEEELLRKATPVQLHKITIYKREINSLRRMVRPVLEIAVQYEKSDSILISPKTIPFIRDLGDHVTQAAEAIEIYKELLNDELTMYHTSIGSRLNDIMRVLTIFSVVFIPLTFIAGVYGANFEYMPELSYQYSYFIFWGVLIVVAIGMLWFFKRKKWL